MEGEWSEDPSVGFLYKAMLERDPRKRRVKPVQQHLLQLDFGGLDDSSDDSDFEFHGQKDSDNSDMDDDVDDEGLDGGSESRSHDSDDSGASQSLDEQAEDADTRVEDNLSIGQLIDRAKAIDVVKPKIQDDSCSKGAISIVSSAKKIKVLICFACLGEVSEEENEIVECDNCGVTVHEGCYGIGDCQSVASTVSSASTEPWFCDACKAGVTPHCELCPNSGGIYKETDTGRWVHIVCALYIPGVAFGDVDKLSPVTLFEMPYTKWGARECTLCEDERFSQTGVCISCDAGMCRNYFHVTCALREGLLSEAAPDEDIADPFYAYCKQHADKLTVRYKRRNWLALQSNVKQSQGLEHSTPAEKARVQRKLHRHRQKYVVAQAKRPVWVPQEKVPRMLVSSASALRGLMRKAELHGINTQTQPVASSKDIRKKWHIPPAFSVEFVGYYLDRNERMMSMKSHLREQMSQRERLQREERTMRAKYDTMTREVYDIKDTNTRLRTEAEHLWKVLAAVSKKPLKLPEVLRPRKPPRTQVARKDIPKSPPANTIIHQCGLCQQTSDQHLLAKCDTCKLYYHLGCLDPPLSRMPKKTKLFGWQCSECASSGSDDSEEESVDPNAPRRLREKIKEPVKWMPLLIGKSRSKGEGHRKGRAKAKKPLTLKRPAEAVNAEATTTDLNMPVLKKEKPLSPSVKKRSPKQQPRSEKSRDQRTECAMCLKPGDNNSLVRCDGCQLCYHFVCLDPPRKTTPKQRGYGWQCSACSPTSSEEDTLQEASVTGPRKRRHLDKGASNSTIEIDLTTS